MNNHGKSDRPIVPEKLPNKGGGAPQPAEGRGRAKGNLAQQTRFRTQGRIDLQHALERIRRAATTPVRHYLRQEPSAVVPHAGICAGGAG
jgi:hypothetical protein